MEMNRVDDRNTIAFILLGRRNHTFGHLANLVHEFVTRNLILFYERKLVFPFSR